MMKRNLIAPAVLFILTMAFLAAPVAAGIEVAGGTKITTTDGATSYNFTITGSNLTKNITIDISSLHQLVESGTFTDANVVVDDTAGNATWAGQVDVVNYTNLTLTLTGGPTVVGEMVNVTFTGAVNPWIADTNAAFCPGLPSGCGAQTFTLTANRTDTLEAVDFDFVIEIVTPLTFSSAATNTHGTKVLVTFNKDVAAPLPVAPAGFTVTVNGADNVVKNVTLNADHKIIELTLTTPVAASTDVVTVTYAPGTIKAADNGVLAAFGPLPVTNNFLGPAPTVTSIAPASGPVNGGTRVTVTGTGFIGATAVKFGAKAGTNLTVKSDTQIRITSPDGAAGAVVHVTVTTPAGTSAANPADRFTYVPAPSVTGVTPAIGINTGLVSVTITGTDFGKPPTVKLHNAGHPDILATNVVWVSATQINCDFLITGVATGNWTLIVTNPDGQNSLSGPNNPFQLIALTIVNAASNPPSNPSDIEHGPLIGTAPVSVPNATAPEIQETPSPADSGKTATVYTNPYGVITQATSLQSNDRLATLTLGLGVVAKDAAGNPLSSVTITAVPAQSLPALPSGTTVPYAGMNYDLKPDGATFSPVISVSFTVPQGQWAQDYTIRSYDRATGTWQDLPTSYDAQTGTVTAEVSHLCLFALFAKTLPSPSPAAAQAQPAQVTVRATPASPPRTIMTNFLGIILWVGNLIIRNPVVAVGIVVLAVGIVLFGWKRRRDRLKFQP
jgi:uncharacterized repeat protein (TIGR02059 family)